MDFMKFFISLTFLIFSFSSIFAESTVKPWSIQMGFFTGNLTFSGPSFANNASSSLLPILLLTPSSSSSSSSSSASSSLNNILLLSTLSGGSSSESSSVSGKAGGSSFYAEYAPSFFGFVFGMSSAYSEFKESSSLTSVLPFLLLGGSSTSNSLTLPLLLSSATQTTTVGIQATTLDFGFNLHMNRQGTFDPYWGLMLGAGGCGQDCVAAKGETKLGLRINFSSSFLFLEGYGGGYALKIAGFTDTQPSIINTGAKFGFGVQLE